MGTPQISHWPPGNASRKRGQRRRGRQAERWWYDLKVYFNKKRTEKDHAKDHDQTIETIRLHAPSSFETWRSVEGDLTKLAEHPQRRKTRQRSPSHTSLRPPRAAKSGRFTHTFSTTYPFFRHTKTLNHLVPGQNSKTKLNQTDNSSP